MCMALLGFTLVCSTNTRRLRPMLERPNAAPSFLTRSMIGFDVALVVDLEVQIPRRGYDYFLYIWQLARPKLGRHFLRYLHRGPLLDLCL